MDNNIVIRLGKNIEVEKGAIETQGIKDAKKIFDLTSGEVAHKIMNKIMRGLEDNASDEDASDAKFYLKTFKDKLFKGAGVEKEIPTDVNDINEEQADALNKLMARYNSAHGKSKTLDKKDYKIVDDLDI